MAASASSVDQVVVAEPRFPAGVERGHAVADARAQIELDRVALAVIEADRLDPGEALKRPGEADGGVLPAGEQDEGGVVGEGHAAYLAVMAGLVAGLPAGRARRRDRKRDH